MIIELHLLQSFPTSNLNRDDVGQPKNVTFGGVVRGRVSSQCLKRSARTLFPLYGLSSEKELGIRTKRLLLLTSRLLHEESGNEEEVHGIVREALAWMGFAIAEKELTQYLFFLGPAAARELADYCRDHREELAEAAQERGEREKALADAVATRQAEEDSDKRKKLLTKEKQAEKKLAELDDIPAPRKKAAAIAAERVLRAGRSVDIALFGRMIANNKDFNVSAASQVAHAISTHAVATEFDFFTAVDDFKAKEPGEDAGADMIGTVDFNAACYYRYANVDLEQLKKNLDEGTKDEEGTDTAVDDLMRRALNAWIRAFVNATPSGKQNSMAAHTRPDTFLLVVREHGSWNLANAFLRPVEGQNLMGDSAERLFHHFDELRKFYGDREITEVAAASVSGTIAPLGEEERVDSLDALVDRALTAASWK